MNVRNASGIATRMGHESTVRVVDLVEKGELAQVTAGSFLRSVAEFEMVDDTPMTPHRHPWPEFYYVLSGTACIQIGLDARLIGRGDFVHIPANEPHTIRTAVTYGQPDRPHVLAFSVAWAGNLAEAENCELQRVEPTLAESPSRDDPDAGR